MLCLLLLILITLWTQIHKENHGLNLSLPIIDHSVQLGPSRLNELKVKHGALTNHAEPITYTSQQLHGIGENFLLNPKLRSIPSYDTLRTIKALKINKRRIRLQHWSKQQRRSVLMSNLRDIPPDPSKPILANKNMTFGTVNARSIKSSINQIVDLLVREHLDFLLVTETWLKPKDDPWLNSQGLHGIGYRSNAIHHPGNKKGGGIMLIYKSTLLIKKVEKLGIPFCEAALWTLSNKKHTFNLLGLYHPPSSTTSTSDLVFTEDLADTISDLTADHKHLIISGDLNIHVNNLASDDAVFFNEAMSSLGLKQHVTHSTHQAGNILDLVLTNPDCLPISKCVSADFVSDHRLVICETDLRNAPLTAKRVKVRKITSIENFASSLDFTEAMNTTTLQDAVDHYESELTSKFNANFLEIVKTFTDRPKVPWFSDSLKAQRLIVRNRERIWLKYSQDHQWEAYKTERNKYRMMLTTQKRQFYSLAVSKVKGDSKALYQLANNLTSHVLENPLPPSTSDSDQSEIFADFFLDKILKIRGDLNDKDALIIKPREGVPVLQKFSSITESDVKRLIMDMKTKSCELDPIPTYILKNEDVLKAALPVLTKIVNLSLSTGTFVQNWKNAVVRPLLKKKGLDLIYKNYRPVSNLQFISKLVEKAVLAQFIHHCDTYNLLPAYQSAYRSGFSCETSVLYLLDKALWAMETQCVLPCVMLDLCAAFDTVDHDIFLEIMEKRFGIKGLALSWFESYLRPRSFKVCVGNNYSKNRDLAFSVPQGSAAGVNFFVSYCESLASVVPPTISLQGFADDHFMHKPFKAGHQTAKRLTISTLEATFNNIKGWMDGMRLKLNPDKTEFIIFGSRQQLTKLNTKSIEVGDTAVTTTPVVKCLGTHLDAYLKMTEHVLLKCKSALYNFHRIASIRKFLDQDSCATLVLTLVISHLDYSNAALVRLPNTLINKYQRIQNMGAKLVLGRSRYTSSTEALKILHWLPIKFRTKFKLIVTVHKCLYGIAPQYLKDLLTIKPPPTRLLRSNTDCEMLLIVPKYKLKTFASRSFSVAGSEEWNRLPRTLRLNNNLSSFKKCLKTLLFENF